MERRGYLASTAALATVALTGCTGSSTDDPDGPGTDPSTDETAQSPTPSPTPSPQNESSLQAGGYALRLSNPRVRASTLDAGTHVDVVASEGTQYLVVEATTDGSAPGDLPLRFEADGAVVAAHAQYVGRPESDRRAAIAFEVPVDDYGSAAIVLDTGDERDRWPVPDGRITALGTAPDFHVVSFEVPDAVEHGQPFQSSFTVANEGARDARFLAEFGHALISDTDEIEVTVPVGEQRTHEETIEPYYESGPETVPVVLDWGLDRRREAVRVVRG